MQLGHQAQTQVKAATQLVVNLEQKLQQLQHAMNAQAKAFNEQQSQLRKVECASGKTH